ncbi:MAG TPA: hypothetical protein VF599_08255 [Pyrinomonadaceae bacterium]|jgi:hypothetical protein
MNNEIKVSICSPPDRKFLVAEIMLGNEQVAELNQEQNTLRLEIYPRRDGQPWLVSYEALLKALIKAKEHLSNE